MNKQKGKKATGKVLDGDRVFQPLSVLFSIAQ